MLRCCVAMLYLSATAETFDEDCAVAEDAAVAPLAVDPPEGALGPNSTKRFWHQLLELSPLEIWPHIVFNTAYVKLSIFYEFIMPYIVFLLNCFPSSNRSAFSIGEVLIEGVVRVLFRRGSGGALGRGPRRRHAASLASDGHGAGKGFSCVVRFHGKDSQLHQICK